MHIHNRLADLKSFYDVVEEVEARLGGRLRLADCSGKMSWPRRGVYFFFEATEARSDSGLGSRVVRVGTHALTATSKASLWNRLSQHRGAAASGGGNHRGSIFRLIIGEALAARDPSTAVPTWGKGQSATAVVRSGESEHEKRVSNYLREMPFVWLDVNPTDGGSELRGHIERNSIALLSNYNREALDPPSAEWLGRFSPREKVSFSGMWNQNHVDEEYDPRFLVDLERLAVGEL